jgi:hypothetical protein
MEELELDFDELNGDFRRFESGKMKLHYDNNNNIDEVQVIDLYYDNGDFWGHINHTYKLGDSVKILNNRMKNIGGIIEKFVRKNNVIKVKLVDRAFDEYFLIDCIK